MLKFRLVYVFFSCLYVVSTGRSGGSTNSDTGALMFYSKTFTEVLENMSKSNEILQASSIKSRKERGAVGHWGYTSENGPSTWGGVCQIGKKQSPINIQLGTVIVKNYPSFAFEENYLSKLKFNAKNNGHTLYVDLEDDSVRPVIYGGGLGNKFIFQQLHLHWESEHEFDGKRADLEMHVVHYNSKYESFAEASTKPDGLVVLAVIFNESEETDSVIEDFFGYILDASTVDGHASHPASPDNYLPGVEVEEKSGFFSLRDLLPKYVSRFFRYDGSLTTPGCGEVVQWTVFINRLPVSSRVLQAFKTLRDHDGNLLSEIYRPPQNLNGREVFIQIENYDNTPREEYGQLANNAVSTKYLMSIIPMLFGLYLLSRFNLH